MHLKKKSWFNQKLKNQNHCNSVYINALISPIQLLENNDSLKSRRNLIFYASEYFAYSFLSITGNTYGFIYSPMLYLITS